MTERWDALVVGGGAAGFFGAIMCATQAPMGAKILIVEKARRVLTKVKISGGGRCNVTHDCFEPKKMATQFYPRGNKALIGPMYRFGVAETVDWFSRHGVTLKTESDGRMFPITDDSQTVIDCLRDAADQAGVAVWTGVGVETARPLRGAPGFEVFLDNGKKIIAHQLLVATGGTRLARSAKIARDLGHKLEPDVPSLFTFHIDDRRIGGLQGLSVENVAVEVEGQNLQNSGPLLITHRGMSGPAILKLSAWGARQLHGLKYRFTLIVNWLSMTPGAVSEEFQRLRREEGKRQVSTRSPFDAIPRRLWQRLVEAARISDQRRWAELTSRESTDLVSQLTAARFDVRGKSTNKDEFVTCGGVRTDDVDMRTMESRLQPGLHFAGEILDIDGVTGGFNFQNAWTTGFLAGSAMARKIESK